MAAAFDTTSWSVVLSARDGDSARAHDALSALCRTYWRPLYAHIRRKGHSREDAEDLTQGFLSHLLAQDFLENVSRDHGRFRTFLLTALDRFLTNEWYKGRTLKRGGEFRVVPLDFATVENRYVTSADAGANLSREYDREWAQTLLDGVLERLEAEFEAAGRASLLAALRPCLTEPQTGAAYKDLSRRLGVSEGAIKVAVHRLRRRYAALLHDEIARTVCTEAEVKEETRRLIEALGSGPAPSV